VAIPSLLRPTTRIGSNKIFLHICETSNKISSIYMKSWNAGVTYYVPTTRLVFAWSWSLLNILAMPKSDIFGLMSLSNKMLLALRSLWIIVNLES
jgi:hypothetical protein